MSFHISEHLFALDLLDLVMKRRFEESPIEEQSLPFTPEIRNFVYSFLNDEEMKINQCLDTVQGKKNVDNDKFRDFVESFKNHCFRNISTFGDILACCITLCQIALFYYRNGAPLAPSIALGGISDFVKVHISTKNENTFWPRLSIEPQLFIKQLSTEMEMVEIFPARKEKLEQLYSKLRIW
ncbi:hypothetical protein TNIN_172551 [Trichonephila inaurata madagascariensis]|uniref:Uncharacterized protein n=1 Tax=Trichonephila inaurata madagascariensis TaxID=2747483 RepID=A0A8X6XIZ4_9ARAC|nr:hypothetical protein TNIN_172551 [Trichonephila inaurata madagascariensis]